MELNNKTFDLVIDTDLNVGKVNQEWTDDHFLKCKNVVMGHVGEQKYHVSEFNIKDSDEEYIYVVRDAEDLLSEENIESIVGKPITRRHPRESITPQNIKKYQKGSVIKAWAVNDEKLMGDIMITDEELAQDVWDGKVTGLSLGYKAKIVQDSNGKYHWKTKYNNHLAVVKKPRAKNAMIFDSEYEGKEVEDVENEPQVLQNVNDTVVKTETHRESHCETEYDTETDEMIEKEIIVNTYRRKPEDKDKDLIAKTIGDQEFDNIDNNKTEKEKQMDKTVLDYMNEYKNIQDSFPESEAKEAELKRVNDECVEKYKVSLVAKEVTEEKTVKDSAFKNIKAVKTEEELNVEDEKDDILVVTDEDLEFALDEFYETLDPMNKAYNKDLKAGIEHLDFLSSANAKTILRKMRKAGNA